MIRLTYTDRCVPSSFYLSETQVWKRVSAVVKLKCFSQKCHLPHLNRNIVEQSFAVPVIFNCLPFKNEPNKLHDINIEKPIYLHVYGLRRAFYLSFVKEDILTIEKWFDQNELCDLLDILRGCCGHIYDLKLVYATPNLGAWEGEKFMLKLYVNDYISAGSFKNSIQVLKESCELIKDLNLNIVHDGGISKDVKWMNKFKCEPCGHLWIKDNQTFVNETENYIELFVYYKDLSFHETEPILLKPEDRSNLLSVITENGLIQSYVESRINQSNIDIQKDFSNWESSKQILQKVYSQDSIESFVAETQKTVNPCKKIAKAKQTLLKLYKQKLRILKKARNSMQTKDEESVFKISSGKKWLVLDIETDYEPNVNKEETILMIACSLFTHDTKNGDCLESRIFTRLPKHVSQKDIDFHQIITMVNTEFSKGNISFPHLENSSRFKVIPCKNEKELLLNFQSYVQQSNCSFIASFNGFKFDLVFIEHRFKVLVMKKRVDEKVASRFFECYFSILPDRGEIKYYGQYKESALRTKGVEIFCNTYKLENSTLKKNYYHINKNTTFDDNDDYDDDEVDNITQREVHDAGNDHGTRSQTNTLDNIQFQGFLKHARNIRIIVMNFVTLVDVMYIVGDPLRGIKLNTAAQKFLNINKLEDIDVEYKNLLQSWKNKTKISKVLAYCLVDTLLLTALIRVKEINLFYCAIASNIGLSEREIYTEESMKRLTAFTNRLGYEENLLTHDTSLYRNELKLWIPESKWKNHDYNHLKPCGGSTMECFGLFTGPIFVADAHACYPSIYQSENICPTSFIENPGAKLNKLADNHIRTIKLENVRPVVEHSCYQERGWCPLNHPGKSGIKCRTKYRYERVTYPVHYVTKSHYISILSRAAHYLMDLRNEYKRLLKLAQDRGDMIKVSIYNEYQRAAKVLANSLYGATMRNFSVIGDSITYMARWQTRQLCQLAQDHNMYVVNGDTDSVFLTFFQDPKVFLNFSTLAMALGLDPACTTVADILVMLIRKANDFVAKVNGNPPHTQGMFPQPYNLGLEEIFLQLFNLAKKSYVGDKILPDSLNVRAHRSGITGKKADTSRIKTICQLMAIKLVFQRDIVGMVRFCKDLYDLGVWFIWLEESKENQISKTIEKDRQLQLNKQSSPYAAVFVHATLLTETRQKIQSIRDKHKACIEELFSYFTPQMFESLERVGDLNKAVTLAAKRALRDYKIMAENPQMIPRTYVLCRSSKVQLASNILKIIQVLVEQSDLSFDSHQHIINQFQHAGLISDLLENKKKLQPNKSITKFDITTIPKIFHAPTSSRYQLKPHELSHLLYLYEYIKTQEQNIEYSHKEDKILQCAPDVENKVIEKRLQDFLENTSIEINPFPPPCCFQGPIAEQVIHNKAADNYIISNSCCDIWEWFHQLPLNYQTPYIEIICNKGEKFETILKPITALPENHSKFIHYNRDQHNFVDLGNTDMIVILDMNSYINQTTSTPVLCSSYDGTNMYITNNRSYGIIKQDYFSVTINRQQLLKTLTSSVLQAVETVIFTGIENTNMISITPSQIPSDLTLTPHNIWRADGRKSTTIWKYPTGIFHVNKQKLVQALNELNGDRKKDTNKYVILSFDSMTKDVHMFLENQMMEIILYSHTNTLKKINYVDDLYKMKVTKNRKKNFFPKEAQFMQNWLSSFVQE